MAAPGSRWYRSEVLAWRLIAFGAVCTALPVAAQEAASESTEADREDRARARFNTGRNAFAEGRYEEALIAFELSYELSGRPVLLYNIGAALDRLQRNAEAITAFERYVTALPDAENRPAVEARLAALRRDHADEQERERQLAQEEQRRRELEEQLAAHESTSVAEKWWFWTIIGVVLVGGAVTAAVLLTRDPGVQDPLLGSTGQVSRALVQW